MTGISALDDDYQMRFITEVLELPGVMVYGETQEEAIRLVKELVVQVLADSKE